MHASEVRISLSTLPLLPVLLPLSPSVIQYYWGEPEITAIEKGRKVLLYVDDDKKDPIFFSLKRGNWVWNLEYFTGLGNRIVDTMFTATHNLRIPWSEQKCLRIYLKFYPEHCKETLRWTINSDCILWVLLVLYTHYLHSYWIPTVKAGSCHLSIYI
jgi:hypothetical protein